MTDIWVHTDEAEDVAGSVRHALRAAEFVDEDPQSWKWVALALHSALQGACVCHLTTSAAPVGALTPKNTREWLEFFEHRREDPAGLTPPTRLMSLPGLLKEVRKANSIGDRSNAEGIPISDTELEWLCRFHGDIRNQLVHFEPLGWSIEVSGIPELGSLIARIIWNIAEARYAFRHLDAAARGSLTVDLSRS